MAIKYFYIDDDKPSTIEETAKGLSIKSEDLIVKPYQHKKWAEQLKFIVDNQVDIDGILFDWGLVCRNEDGEEADFNVEALAQQIRRLTIGKESTLKIDFPIVLCSAQERFKEIFPKELTGHDLFDEVYEKSDFIEPKKVIYELVSLAKGYKDIDKMQSSIILLGLSNEEETDDRIIDRLNSFLREESPVHEIARFILTKIIKISGVLIDEYLLAARLNVDILSFPNNSSWTKLSGILEESSYRGVFSDFSPKWWANKVEDWIEEKGLGSKSPDEKVAFFNKEYNLELKVAEKTEKSRSNDFWVVCKETKRPIALEDAVLALAKDRELSKVPWQEDEYYSIDTALETDINLIHPVERDRMQKLKTIHTQKRPVRR